MANNKNLRRGIFPTILQIQYMAELERLGNKRGNVAVIAEKCGVGHSSVSKFFKTCYENGYLTEDYSFTAAGKQWLKSYQEVILGLAEYFQSIGVPEAEIPEQIKSMVENVEYHVLKFMVDNYRNSKNTKTAEKKREYIFKNKLDEVLKYGSYPVDFILFRLNHQDGTTLSMANRGFEKPALLKHNKRGSSLQLTIKKMEAESRIDGRPMEGVLKSLKYEENGMLFQAEIKDGMLRIPLEACLLNVRQGGEVRGIIPVTVTCSVGREHMPESTAMLVFWL